MKTVLFFFLLLSSTAIFGQNKTNEKILFKTVLNDRKIEDRLGHLITDAFKRKVFFENEQKNISLQRKKSITSITSLSAVPLCSNGSFEEFDTISGTNVLKNYEYIDGAPLNPMQCKPISEVANLRIKQYDPNDVGLMVSTVPSNFIDEFIGNINAYDQYTLKLNYKESSPTMGLLQAKRFKTNNETQLVFNYKAVLQSITTNDHDNEQPYFKARVVNHSGVVVDEFCLIGTPTNCIFKQANIVEGGNIILYTPNWQAGILNISSIPNNENFTLEIMASRCGLNGHFGYAYVDDICLLHANENLQGSIQLDPLYKICPTLPISVCGSFTIPTSGTINATVTSVVLNVRDATGTVIYTSQTPTTLDLVTKRFCFDLVAANLPNIITESYNVSATINFGITQTNCSGTSFNSATDDDANPGWDIWFLNCVNCNVAVQTTSLTLCDNNNDGKEFFNLSNVNSGIVTNANGLTFSYFTNLTDATNNTNPIVAFTNYESYSTTIFVRVTQSATCYKIIGVQLIVKNPFASISGILNVCSGSTTLTASPGVSYLWAGSLQTTQSISVGAVGTYTVRVTDSYGCIANGSVTILSNSVAPLPSIVLTQPTCFTATGAIQVTSTASEYSYDNGVTWETNSIKNNLPYGTYSVKIRTASGCTSYNSNVSIIPYLSSFPDFTSVDPLFCGDRGSITITSTAAEYSFDDGVTWTTNNIATGLASGIYLIRTKDAQGCISNFNSVSLSSEFLALPLYVKDNPFCGALGGITITTPAMSFSIDGGTTWQASNVFLNLTSGSYLVKIRDSQGCTSPNAYVYLNNLQDSYPDYDLTEAGCGTYASLKILTPGDEYSFDGGATWSTNNTLDNLNGPANFQVVVKKGINCRSYTGYVYLNSHFLAIPTAIDYHINLCDKLNDGSENVDLTFYNTNLIANVNAFGFSYFTTAADAEIGNATGSIANYTACNLSNTNNTVYVRVTSADACHKVAALSFTFIDSPRIVMEDKYPLCEFKTVLIEADSGFDSYTWSTTQTTNAITIASPGNYWVVVTEDHGSLTCDSRKDFNIFLSNPATITKIEEFDWTENNNSIIITVTGLGIYEYSIDGIVYQDSNEFTGLLPGIYHVYVRDKFGCGTVLDEAVLLNYSKYFTPNGDGINDNWRINFSQYEADFKVKIFDRYGKMLKVMNCIEAWDGTYNGSLVPSDDYWFYVTRSDGKIHKGHFAMKR